MPGPLPDPESERRNAPTIPTTRLPAGGRRGAVPKVPAWRVLGDAGQAWWDWAWRTPQACAWDDGQLVKVADRAALEDDLAGVQRADEIENFLGELANVENLREAKAVIGWLSGLVAGKLQILQKMTDIDDRLGLSPKGRDQLRMKIVADKDYYPLAATPAKKAAAAKVTKLSDRRSRSVDAS